MVYYVIYKQIGRIPNMNDDIEAIKARLDEMRRQIDGFIASSGVTPEQLFESIMAPMLGNSWLVARPEPRTTVLTRAIAEASGLSVGVFRPDAAGDSVPENEIASLPSDVVARAVRKMGGPEVT